MVRAVAVSLAVLAVGTLLCFLVLSVPFRADTGPAIAATLACGVLELSAIGIGSYLASARARTNPMPAAVGGGMVAYAVLVGFTVIAASGDDSAAMVALLTAPVALGVSALGGLLGKRRP